MIRLHITAVFQVTLEISIRWTIYCSEAVSSVLLMEGVNAAAVATTIVPLAKVS